MGLLADDKKFIDAIIEANNLASRIQLRRLFVTLLLMNTMSKPDEVWNKTWKLLLDDIDDDALVVEEVKDEADDDEENDDNDKKDGAQDWYDITEFKEWVLEERWKHVINAYENDSEYHKVIINESRGTALHVAVNDGNVELVSILVEAILRHEGRGKLSYESALRSTNERGNTPLHLAASRGFIGMCKFIIGENGERKDLIRVRNNNGETPIFKAGLTGQTKAFVYLHAVSKDLDVSLRNDHEDTILHQAIWREFLDLAIIINHCYPGLVNIRNNDDATPLKVLACRPSAFKSGNNLPWWKQILYYCKCCAH
ncbi:uncharacterized protein [Phaseolus vulgaris]|uniref:uncharacterized protein n=1 Tax=Phaseolus vulgaris TaxID=3885 RepID=UPI0035C9867C